MARLLRTTAFRWSAGIAIWSTLLATALSGFLYWRTAALTRSQLDDEIRRELSYATELPDLTRQRIETWLGEDLHGVRFAAVFAGDGSRRAGNLDAVPAGLTLDGSVQRLQATVRLLGRDVDDQLWAAGLRTSDGGSLVVALDTDAVDRVRSTVLDALVLALGPTLGASVLGGVVLSRRARRRLIATEAALATLARGDLSGRLPSSGGGDEFDRLAGHVNELLSELERLVGEIRGVGDAIAHDLRTPLTRLRIGLERARVAARTVEEFRVVVDASLERLDGALSLVTAVLRIGEIEHGRRKAAFSPTDLGEVLGAVAEFYEPLAHEKGVRLETLIDEDCPMVLGDRDLLLETAANLLDNAVKFTPGGGVVRLTMAATPKGVEACFEDSGPGVRPEDRDRVFERFFRAEPARGSPGHGLGLGLAAAVSRLHGFSLSVGPSRDGGARFTLLAPKVTFSPRRPGEK